MQIIDEIFRRESAVVEVKLHSPKKVESRIWSIARVSLGWCMLIFAGGHAGAGIYAANPNQPVLLYWMFTMLWCSVAVSLYGAGIALLGVRLPGGWKPWTRVGSASSILLIASSWQWWLWPVSIVSLLLYGLTYISVDLEPSERKVGRGSQFFSRVASALALISLVYGATVIAVRPLHQNWGATPDERIRPLPRDEQSYGRRYDLNHVVTVDAPPEKIYPWIIELGQDKAGFYSYDFLERAVGDDVHNRFELRTEWQQLKEGDFIRGTQDNYLWGWKPAQNAGWTVTKLIPNRMMVLDQWGVFWIDPLPGNRSRFGVRSAMGNIPFCAAPIHVFAFEPAHFIMEQKMLRTIKELAENR